MSTPVDFKRMVESTGDMIFRIDQLGAFLYANPATVALTGYSAEELKGLDFFGLMSGKNRVENKTYYKAISAGLPTGPSPDATLTLKDGSLLWVSQEVQVEKETKSFLVIARNITERVKADHDKDHWNLRLIILIENLQEGILMEDENRKIIFANRAFCDLFSVRLIPEDLIGKNYKNAQNHIRMLFQDTEEFLRIEDEVVNNAHIVIGQGLKLKNGRVYERDYVPIYIETGYAGNLWKYRDSTEKVRTRNELLKAKNNYQNVIETMRLGLLEVDHEDRITNANAAFCEILGYPSSKELVGKKSFETLLDDEQQELMKTQMASREKGDSNTYEIKVKRADGGHAWMLISGAALVDEKENVIGSVGVHLDITYQKRVAMELEEKKALKNMMEWQEKALLNLEDKVNERTSEVLKQKEIIEFKNTQMMQGVEYAFRIQQALLPPLTEIQKTFHESFIIHRPMDVVGGDFYFYKKVSLSKCFLCVADSTGHGVPGGFMSMLGFENIKEAISKGKDPGDILSIMHNKIRSTLSQEGEDFMLPDGYDMAVCMFDLKDDIVHFAGANRPMWITRGKTGELQQVKGTRASIGGHTPATQEFDTVSIPIEKGDCLYLFTDGCTDQFSEEGRRISTKRFYEALLAAGGRGMEEQERYIERFLQMWQGSAQQTDDIMLVGIKY